MKKRQAYLLFLIATIIWGFAFVAQKAAVVLPPFTVCALRAGIAAIFIFALIPFTDKFTGTGRKFLSKKGIDLTKQELICGSVLGVILTASSVMQQAGLTDTDAGKAAFITTLYVLFVPIISAVLGKKPTVSVFIGVPVAIFGFYMLCIKPGIGISGGDLLVLTCGIVFAFHIICVDKFTERCEGVRLSLIQFAVSFLLNCIIGIFAEGLPSPTVLLSVLPALLFLGIGSSGIAYTLQIIGQKYADPSVTSLILSLEAVFATVGGTLVLGETMNRREILGCAMVLIAVIIAQTEPDFIAKLFKKSKNANKT